MFDEIGLSKRKEEKSLVERIEDEIYYTLKDNINDENGAEELSGLVDEILELIPYDLFKSDFLSDIEEKKNSFEEPERDYDEDFNRDLGGSVKKDDDADRKSVV